MCPINFRWEETYTPTMHSASLTLAHNALLVCNDWASVSEPHPCDFNATFSLYVCYISICDRHCTFDISFRSYTRRARNCPDAARRGAVGPTWYTAKSIQGCFRMCTLSVRYKLILLLIQIWYCPLSGSELI